MVLNEMCGGGKALYPRREREEGTYVNGLSCDVGIAPIRRWPIPRLPRAESGVEPPHSKGCRIVVYT